MDVEVSVVIPCLNEERTLGVCIRKAVDSFSKLGCKGEIVVVDNGSTDDSALIAAEEGARVVRHEIKGYGSALKRGMREARGKYILMGDGDNTYDFCDMGAFVRLLREGADFVMGNRLGGEIYPGAMPPHHRWFGTPVLTALLNLFFGAKISDVNCGLRGFKKDSVEGLDLRSNGMEFASEMVMKAVRKKLVIKETPIHYFPPPLQRVSHLRSLRDGWRHLKFMLLFCPKYLFLLPGLVLSLIGMGLVALMHFKTLYIFGMPLGLSAAAFAGGLFFVGVHIVLFGGYSIIFSISQGWMEDDRISRFIKTRFTLEKGLIIGGGVLALGIVMCVADVYSIVTFAPNLPHVHIPLARFAIISVFIVLIGLEIIFSSFYLSLFNLSETLR